MTIGHDALISLVAKVNGPLALVSWPFALYEVFAKNPGIPELKEKLDLRRNQLLKSIALDLAARLRPYWPTTASRIIIEPNYVADEAPSLSDDAIDEMKECLETHEKSLHIVIKLRRISYKVLRLNGFCYWFIFATAVVSLGALALWFFSDSMSDQIAIASIGVPILTAFFALICAGIRQSFIHSAHGMIVGIED